MIATSSTLIFTRDSKSIKKPLPRKLKFPQAEFTRYYTENTVTLPSNSQGNFCSKYKDEIEQFL